MESNNNRIDAADSMKVITEMLKRAQDGTKVSITADRQYLIVSASTDAMSNRQMLIARSVLQAHDPIGIIARTLDGVVKTVSKSGRSAKQKD